MKQTDFQKDKDARSAQKKLSLLTGKYKTAFETIERLERERDAAIKISATPQLIDLNNASFNKTGDATAIVLASDWHIEETVRPETVNNLNHFTVAIASYRIKQFFENTLKLVRKEQQQVKIQTLVIALLGDFISGNIHEELMETCSLRPINAIIAVQNLIISGITFLLKNSKLNLVIPCSVGNHPRVTRRVHIANEQGNNLEYFMYHNIRNYFRNEKRITFLIAEGYLSFLKVYDYKIRFHHGHHIRYAGGVGGVFIPANKAIAEWQKMKGYEADLDCFG